MAYYLIKNGKVAGVYARPQSLKTVFIEEPRPSEFHKPTFTGGISTENFTGWVLDAEVWFAAETKKYESAVAEHLNSVAGEHGYDNISTACEYAAAPNVFQAESQAFIAWRAAVWQSAYAQLQAVETAVAQGNDELPTIEDVIAALPVFEGGEA